jgi:hypothetical protein
MTAAMRASTIRVDAESILRPVLAGTGYGKSLHLRMPRSVPDEAVAGLLFFYTRSHRPTSTTSICML